MGLLLAAAGVVGEEELNTNKQNPESGVSVEVAAPGRWVLIKAGSFTMGSPEDEKGARGDDEVQHQVTLSRDFILQATEVTQRQWQEVMGNTPSRFDSCRDCPVERVTWFEAAAYTNALSKREGLPECYRLDGCDENPGDGMVCSSVSFAGLRCDGYRLPTEAEWEYAVRAGSTGALYGELDQIAWTVSNSCRRTHPVGEKQPNRWGLFDMFGNVREWCHDWYGPFTKDPVRDPLGAREGTIRVRRGGCRWYLAGYTRAADRNGLPPRTRRSSIGLRPARTYPRTEVKILSE